MRSPRARIVRVLVRLLLIGSVTGVITFFSPAEAGGGLRSLADKLQYGPGVVNHPVHVVPSEVIHIPEHWPLDVDGSITCVTCHETLPPLNGANGSRGAYLRDFDEEQAEFADFCAKCHTAGGSGTAATMHWTAVGTAHVRANDKRAGRPNGNVDGESRRCLGCHDGVTAADARNATAGDRIGDVGDVRRNHPIGVRYPHGPIRQREVAFRPASLLPPEVRLPDGSVSCVSCHNLYSRSRYLLSVPIENSTLCFTCHDI